MLLILMIIQALLTLILNQTYQSMIAQWEVAQPRFPPHPAQEIQACFHGRCSDKVRDFSIQRLGSNEERQFFNAQLTLCEHGECWEITQLLSESSAILKREQYYYAIKVQGIL
jgi:hypothetical protein